MSFSRLFRVCASALLCAGLLLSAENASANGAGTVVDGRAILRMSKGSDLCALTFDDGPSTHTARHEIGNHTFSHRSLRHLGVDAQRGEILSVQEALRKLGVHSRYIRPPYGNFDANTVAIAREEGADIMLWSVDSMDWSKRASIENMKTLINGQKLRGVFLFHDTHMQTIDALPEILDRLIADGCRFVTVSEYLAALRRDALPEGVKVAEPAPQAAPAEPQPSQAAPAEPQPSQAAEKEPDALIRPGDVHEVRQPLAPKAGPEQLAGHSTNTGGAPEPQALETSMLGL